MASAIDEKIKLYSEFEKSAMSSMDTLYNFALRMTGSSNNAVKLLTKAYSKAFWFFDHLDESINVKEWMFRVTRNTFFNDFKMKKENGINVDEVEQNYEKIKASNKDFTVLKENLNLSEDDVSAILLSLPEDLRIVIVLCDVHKFSYEEIADFVDVPVGVVVSRLQRARKIFFTLLLKQKNKL